jgi:hypothetical protein
MAAGYCTERTQTQTPGCPPPADESFAELDLDRMDIIESGSRAINVTNPFEKRTGKTLVWTGVNMTLQTKDGGTRKLLQDVWGEVPAGQTTAVMGASSSRAVSRMRRDARNSCCPRSHHCPLSLFFTLPSFTTGPSGAGTCPCTAYFVYIPYMIRTVDWQKLTPRFH